MADHADIHVMKGRSAVCQPFVPPAVLPARPVEAWPGCPLRALGEALRRVGLASVEGGCTSACPAKGGGVVLLSAGDPAGRAIDVFDVAASAAAIAEELARPRSAAIVARGRCPLRSGRRGSVSAVVERRCNRCGACLRLGCPAISEGEEAMAIDPSACAGCGLCRQVCRAGAIVECPDPGPRRDHAEGAAWRARAPGRRPTSIVLAGVLGQPVLATARLLVRAARSSGLAASASELQVPGSPGSVAAYVRIGHAARHEGSPPGRADRTAPRSSGSVAGERTGGGAAGVLSPIQGEADVLLGFEPLEALRAAPLLSPRAFVALCDRLLPTFRMRARLEPRPDDLVARLRAVAPHVEIVPAAALVALAVELLPTSSM